MTLARRRFLQTISSAILGSSLAGAYAFAVEPFRLRVQHYDIAPRQWPEALDLTIVALADIHAGRPWMSPERIRSIVETANQLKPDMIVLLGDYPAGHRWVTGKVEPREWAAALSGLAAPLGVYAILGNHDWWGDPVAQKMGEGPTLCRIALEDAGIPVLENDAVRLQKNGQPFWVAGLGDQVALLGGRGWGRRARGVDDLPGTLAKVTDACPIVLLAHEPDIFATVPGRVSLTLAGHTHGGQVRVFGYSPVIPSRFGNRYAYGHIVERTSDGVDRHLVVSGGLGCSGLPVRFGVPPEITVVRLSNPIAS